MTNLGPEARLACVIATVRWFDDKEGRGVLDAPEAPGGIFVHYSAIDVEGYKTLREEQAVEVDVEGPLAFDQDGCRYRALRVVPLRWEPTQRPD
jgi:CspA family cold shock protein